MDDLDHVVPLTVFTDAFPLRLQKSCVVISFSSLLAQGHEKLTKYPHGSCVKQSGGQVDIGAWDRLIADLLALTTGVVGGTDVCFRRWDQSAARGEHPAGYSTKGFESLLGSQTDVTGTSYPKVYKILHYPYFARVINPKAVQNYGEEALIGTVTNTWKRSISGRYKKKVQVNVLTKRIVALPLRLHFPLAHERSFSRCKG